MRKEKELINVHGGTLRLRPALDAPETRAPEYLKALFLPRKETRVMAEEAQRTGGVFLPYPLLGLTLTLVLALGTGIAGLFIQVNSLSTTLLLRDSDYQARTKELKEKLELLSLQINDLQVKDARRDEREKKTKGRDN